MAKKGWFSIVKRLFRLDTHSTQDKKEKRRKCVFGRLKTKRLHSIEAPPTPSLKETKLCEAEEEHNKHALTVAIASAEAALAAAHVAVEVVRLQSDNQSTHKCKRKIEESSAIKIQTTFRGYLARKALKALKGIVKLQAIIRGRAIRRQAMSTLKCLQSIVSIQSQVLAKKVQMVEGRWNSGDKCEEMHCSRDKIIRMDLNSERNLLKKEVDSCNTSKKKALMKEIVKEYSYNHRKSDESERNKTTGRWRYWMENWVDTQLSKSKEHEDLDSIFNSHCRELEDCGRRQLKLRHVQRENEAEGVDSQILSSRNFFPQKSQNSERENHLFPNSNAIPTYMASTKSTLAKVRSISTPKTRIGGNWEMNSDCYSPCNRKISHNQQGSPTLKRFSKP